MNPFRDMCHSNVTVRLAETIIIICNQDVGITTLLSAGVNVAELDEEVAGLIPSQDRHHCLTRRSREKSEAEMKCTNQRRDGKRCQANAISGQPCCFLHSSPGKASELGKTGGARRRVFDLSKLRRFSPAQTPGDLLAIVSESLCDLRAGRLDHKTASVIGSLATVAQALMRSTTLEERLARLEETNGRRS